MENKEAFKLLCDRYENELTKGTTGETEWNAIMIVLNKEIKERIKSIDLK